jgi:twitching motility protein PilT
MTNVISQEALHPSMNQWVTSATARQASDIHLVAGHPPTMRCHGRLFPLDSLPLTELTIRESMIGVVPIDLLDSIASTKNLDLAVSLSSNSATFRLRVNLFLNEGTLGACLRIIPEQIPDFAWNSFPEETSRKLCSFRTGLVLMAGITGSGKSTSLAMIITKIITRGDVRIVTLEDPIEYRFPLHPTAIVTQRELGTDIDTFADGLKFALRQDPDVILVGEIRDAETARLTLSAAETGHLVLSTLHTRDAKGAISRYADLFPSNLQTEVRAMLAANLRAIVCQKLLESGVPGDIQDLALEVMYNTPAIASSIRMGKLESIDNYILTGKSEGMVTMDESIRRLRGQSSVDF